MKIQEIKLYTTDIKETKTFYTSLLNFSIVKEEATLLTLKVGDSLLTFIQTDTATNVYHFAFNIAVNHLEQAIAWSNKHLELLKSPSNTIITAFETWNAESIYFTDNNGNILEFIARYDLNNRSERAFTPKEVLNISEIGIVTPSPIKLAEELIVVNDLKYFSKTKPTPEFLALGDDEGLLILVTPNRKWYPTTIEALPTNQEITLINNNQEITLDSSHCIVETQLDIIY
ncbi:VOC family protein [Myroides injenensis]|uniref:VOC family protein n=1 Tax=Myroides injenensis TaxID=1183151 RepID=UPI000289E59C|nr:VOC family protein [Myroides injenensis]